MNGVFASCRSSTRADCKLYIQKAPEGYRLSWIVRNSVLSYVHDVGFLGLVGAVFLKAPHNRVDTLLAGVHSGHSDREGTFLEAASSGVQLRLVLGLRS